MSFEGIELLRLTETKKVSLFYIESLMEKNTFFILYNYTYELIYTLYPTYLSSIILCQVYFTTISIGHTLYCEISQSPPLSPLLWASELTT